MSQFVFLNYPITVLLFVLGMSFPYTFMSGFEMNSLSDDV